MKIETSKILVEAREKLVEKDIEWGQVYTDKTQFLKDMYADIVGPGSYFRFEGTDRTSGDSYYCIIGPARIHKPRAKFFAGVRKLPATFSAGGKYFDSLDAAARYARETWGVSTPKELHPYTSASLYGISSKSDEWKKSREKEKEDDKEDDSNDKTSSIELFNLDSHYRKIHGMSKPQVYRDQATWWNYEDIIKYKDLPEDQIPPKIVPQIRSWNMALQNEPTLLAVLAEAEEFREGDRGVFGKVQSLYGMDSEESKKVFQVYLGYHPEYGAYITSVGPYIGKGINEPDFEDKFGYYVIKKSRTSMNDIMRQAENAARKYQDADLHFNKPRTDGSPDPRSQLAGADLSPSDFYVQFRGLKGTSFFEGRDKDDPSLRIDNLSWELNIPSSIALAKEYKGKANWLKGRHDEAGAAKLSVEMMAKKYNTTVQYMTTEIGTAGKARSQTDLDAKGQENERRLGRNQESNPEAYAFLERAPMVRTGTVYKLKPSGQFKVIQQYFNNLGIDPSYWERGIDAVQSKYAKQYPTREDLVANFQEDKTSVNRVYNAAISAYQQDVNGGSAAPIDFLAFGKLNIKTSAGQQQFGALPTNDSQARQLEMRMEIAEALTKGVTKIREIQGLLGDTEKRKSEQQRHIKEIGQASPEVSYDFIREQLSVLRDESQKNGYSDFSQLLADMKQQHGALKNSRGFNDLQTAYDMLGLYFTSLPVDPRTRAKYVTKRKRMQFNPPEGFENYDASELYAKRTTGVLPEPEVEIVPSQSEAAEQIDDIEGQQLVDEEITQMVKEPTVEKIEGEPQEEIELGVQEEIVPPSTQERPINEYDPNQEEDTVASVRKLNTAFRKTVGNLIRVARELDQEGKGEASEEIHKVIRKYQEGLK